MQVLDLFSGIGGFSIGLEKAGFETAAFCEIEDYPRAVLRKHWPDTPIYRDVKQLTGEQLRADGIFPDVIVGGYPCQPFSAAGRQRGEEDPRHLWPEVHRLIRELRPRWVICENVSGHIKLGLDEVLATLEAEGYTCWPFIIPACSVDAPHKRDRVFIVADSTRERLQGRTEEPAYGVGDLSRQSERGGTDFRDGWPTEPNVGRVANGVPTRTHRIKALGNAVVPQIPEAIGLTIMRYENAQV
jgi:DNA (cytosine-5)-methyltransferase 1